MTISKAMHIPHITDHNLYTTKPIDRNEKPPTDMTIFKKLDLKQ